MDKNVTESNIEEEIKWDDLKGNLSPENITKYHSNLKILNNELDEFLTNTNYEKLSVAEQIKFDLFVSYTLCSLHWMYLRNIGKCPVKNGIKVELDKIKQHSDRLQIIEDRKLRPKIEKSAAKRMVKHELWQNDLPKNKKIKFSDDDS